MKDEVDYFWRGRLTTLSIALRDANVSMLHPAVRTALSDAFYAVNRALHIMETEHAFTESARRAQERSEGR